MLQQDMALVEKWRARRDADAFAVIVRRHAALVYATSLRITRNRADAEDVAQECFAALVWEEPGSNRRSPAGCTKWRRTGRSTG